MKDKLLKILIWKIKIILFCHMIVNNWKKKIVFNQLKNKEGTTKQTLYTDTKIDEIFLKGKQKPCKVSYPWYQ